MFVPKPYRANGPLTIELTRRHPLALLVSNGPTVPLATHLPVIRPPYEVGDDRDDLTGVTLYGHMNRRNPHWEALHADMPALLIFHGPNSYVSAATYEVTPAAPTWNFTSVHVHGTLRPVADRDATLQIVRWTVETFEAEFGAGWDMGPSLDYFDKIVDGVGGFTLEVESVDSMFKLSQEQPPEIQAKVTASFAASDHGGHRDLAALMTRVQAASADTAQRAALEHK